MTESHDQVSDNSMVNYIKTYSLNKNVKKLLERINPMLAKKEDNIRIHLHALRNSLITEEEFQTIEAKMKLGQLCIELEEVIKYARVALIFYDEEENNLYHGAAPNVPHCFFDIFEEINEKNMFGSQVGSCGPAIYNQAVTSTIIRISPNWKAFRDHLLSFQVLAAWSIPFYYENRVIGTFSIYLSEERRPTLKEIQLIKEKIVDFERSILLLSRDYLKMDA